MKNQNKITEQVQDVYEANRHYYEVSGFKKNATSCLKMSAIIGKLLLPFFNLVENIDNLEYGTKQKLLYVVRNLQSDLELVRNILEREGGTNQ